MPYSAGPNIAARPNLVFEYDTGDVQNSYKGEPTTNVMRQSDNVTGTQYGYNDEYSTCELVKTWLPNIVTPVGVGATQLTQQAVNSIWHCLNWFDDSEDGKRCLSAYIYPITPGINNFTIGMVGDPGNSVIFNLDTGATTIGAGLANANPFYTPVPGAPGWYRVGANIEGRVGGWVASIGLGQTATYTPTAPFKSFYICGIQYERNIATHCTQFTQAQTTRSSTQGLLDVSGKGNVLDLANVSFDSNAQIVFDGTNDYINIPSSTVFDTQTVTVEVVVKPNGLNQYGFWFEKGIVNTQYSLFMEGTNIVWRQDVSSQYTSTSTMVNNAWNHVVGTFISGDRKTYVNGVLRTSDALYKSLNINQGNQFIGSFNSGGYYYNGQIAIVRVYNSTLSTAQVLQNYNQLKTRFNLQ